MKQKILLDTNAYLRLGEVFYPLLMSELPGDGGGEFWILAELYQELQRNPRLRTQFSWASNPEMIENRKRCRWYLDKPTRAKIESVFEFALQYSQRIGNGASPFDIRCLAYGLVLGIPVVTDDRDMTALAEDIEVKILSTLELLHRMVANGFCELDKVRSTIRYWIAVDDLPGGWRREYMRLFGELPPETAY